MSAACAVAWAPAVLIAARVAQGAGAALLSPAALAALHDLVPPPARERALGWWTAAAAGGGASGWVLGGALTELAGWRWVFAVNVPIGLAALVPAGRLLPPGVRRTARTDLDLAGAVLVTAAIAAGVLGLSRIGEPAGWGALALAMVLLGGFLAQERRATRPLVPRGLLRRPGVLGGNLTAIALNGSSTPAMITVVLYVQETLRLSPARGALLFPAFNAAVIAGSLAQDPAPDDLDDALRRLEAMDERQARIVELRFFVGLSENDIAEALGVSERTVQREWRIAREWLKRELSAA